MKYATTLAWLGALGFWTLCALAASAAADGSAMAPGVDAGANKIAEMEAQCAMRSQTRSQSPPAKNLFARLGGEARIHVITREMVRLHQANPVLSDIVRKYNPEYLADILARYLITATGGPRRYKGRPLNETHAHLHITSSQFLAGGTDFSEAMKAVGASQDDIVDTLCLLGTLKSQIVQK